ncbi:Transposon Tf2-8 polyprotein [Dictyocoela muelleri]|nr:Transposon Tf2-8 polyprotein [Dictyocoela muelleri]
MIIDTCGILSITSKLFKYEDFKVPKTIKQLQSLIGFLNWFRSFIPDISSKLHDITELHKTKKSSKNILWTPNHTNIINKVFNEIKEQNRLYYSDYSKPFYIYADTSDFRIGTILKQDLGIIGIFSKKLSGSQMNYTFKEKETLAIILSLQHF